MTKPTDGFLRLDQDPQIRYEKGALNLAESLAPYLDPAIHTVETQQGKFKTPVIIYVPGSVDSFSDYCASTRPSACVIGERLFISAKLFNDKKRLPGILSHELSHLQLTQAMGVWDYQTHLPTWLKEGLAVYVSNGSGAEGVSVQKAADAITRGKTFKPNASGSLLFRKTASSFDLNPHMFYRQSAMFVQWLHDRNPEEFQQLLHALKKGKMLNDALISIYGFGVQQGWSRFVSDIAHLSTPQKKA